MREGDMVVIVPVGGATLYRGILGRVTLVDGDHVCVEDAPAGDTRWLHESEVVKIVNWQEWPPSGREAGDVLA